MIERTLLKTKILNATVTGMENETEEDAIWIERSLLKHAELWPYERVEVSNHTNGARFTTVVRSLESNSGVIAATGASRILAKIGDVLEISSYVSLTEQDLVHYQFKRIVLKRGNTPA